MSKMSNEHVRQQELAACLPDEPDDSDYDAPAEPLRYCDVCDQPGTPDNPVTGPVQCSAGETYCHSTGCEAEQP